MKNNTWIKSENIEFPPFYLRMTKEGIEVFVSRVGKTHKISNEILEKLKEQEWELDVMESKRK